MAAHSVIISETDRRFGLYIHPWSPNPVCIPQSRATLYHNVSARISMKSTEAGSPPNARNQFALAWKCSEQESELASCCEYSCEPSKMVIAIVGQNSLRFGSMFDCSLVRSVYPIKALLVHPPRSSRPDGPRKPCANATRSGSSQAQGFRPHYSR